MPLIGGTPRAFLDKGATAPAWSPDGTRLAYFKNEARRSSVCRRSHRRRRPPDPRACRGDPQPQSGLVARRPVDLLRARIGTDRRDGRVAHSTLGRIAGATDQPARRREFPGAARLAHAALRGARGGPVGAVAVGARCRAQGDAPRDARGSINTHRCRPVATAGASSPPSPTPPPACGACRAARSSGRGSRRPTVSRCRRRGRWLHASAGHRCSICPPAGRATGCGGSRTDRRPKSGRARTGRCPSRPRCRRTEAAWPSSSGRRESGTCRSCRRTARSSRTLAPSIDIQGAVGPGHRGLVAGRHVDRHGRHATRRVRGCSRSPWMAVRPFGSSPVRRSIPSGRRTAT